MKKYSIIYADPPWAYRTYSKKGQGRSAESHYPTMCMSEIIQCVADMRTQDVKAIREFAKFVPAFASFEKNRLALYRDAAKEAEDIFDRWADEFDDLDEDYEPDEFFSD